MANQIHLSRPPIPDEDISSFERFTYRTRQNTGENSAARQFEVGPANPRLGIITTFHDSRTSIVGIRFAVRHAEHLYLERASYGHEWAVPRRFNKAYVSSWYSTGMANKSKGGYMARE